MVELTKTVVEEGESPFTILESFGLKRIDVPKKKRVARVRLVMDGKVIGTKALVEQGATDETKFYLHLAPEKSSKVPPDRVVLAVSRKGSGEVPVLVPDVISRLLQAAVFYPLSQETIQRDTQNGLQRIAEPLRQVMNKGADVYFCNCGSLRGFVPLAGVAKVTRPAMAA